MKKLRLAAFCVAVIGLAAGTLAADEIKLKDGKKLNGVIVGYEDNMFRVKTDFGFVLVEKDKIASIVPTDPAGKETSGKAAGRAADAVKSKTQPAPAAAAASTAESPESAAKPKISDAAVKPSLPAASTTAKVAPPAIKSIAPSGAANTPSGTPALAMAQPPAPPKEPELPANKEEVQGTLYTNFSHGFRMYKAPSWELIEDARQALPNAIVAMGTANESTLMVVGQEKLKDTLEGTAAGVEKRLREIYSNYRPISQRKSVVGGAAAVEYKYRGTADEHDWSGTLVVVGRGKDVLTILGMTYAESDLIQIQENVIARAIASTNFDVPKFTAEK
ncbi:MAG TPA: hypothetical protein VLC94_02925 [Candidatus Acidoferrum sp.]|nr:hypothetical protein [Candidatus Acidoferrum sp.]